MPIRDDLGMRMKNNYEEVSKTRLLRRTPVAIRLDGQAFHTFTKGFRKPFDHVLVQAMQETLRYLCENVQGCIFGYTQSDEITLILQDYKTLTTSAWFDYEVQKICSIAASMCTMFFNKKFKEIVEKEIGYYRSSMVPQSIEVQQAQLTLFEVYQKAINKGATFDCRVFNIPKEEVTNLIYWRQLDASRNSVNMFGQAYFSHKELQNKTCKQIQEMLFHEKGVLWSAFPAYQKRGTACIKTVDENGKSFWKIDDFMPKLAGEGRKYVEDILENIEKDNTNNE